MIVVNYMVEGMSDEPMAQRLLTEAGAVIGLRNAAGGKPKLDPKLAGINRGAQASNPWLVVRDLNNDDASSCLPDVIRRLLHDRPLSDHMVLRLAVRAMESWVLADRTGCARFLAVSTGLIPQVPDELSDPKAKLIELARRSQRRNVREGLAPTTTGGRRVGPLYVSLVGGFVRTAWSPERARESSPSLDRALTRMSERVVAWQQ